MIIKDIKELEGSCYIEVLPGKYLNKCWNDSSIFSLKKILHYLKNQ